MSSFIITYDLVNSRDYQKLYDAIQSLGNWARVVESVWIVTSELSSAQIRDELLKYIDDDDRIFVTKSSGEAAWRNTRCSGEWIKNNF